MVITDKMGHSRSQLLVGPTCCRRGRTHDVVKNMAFRGLAGNCTCLLCLKALPFPVERGVVLPAGARGRHEAAALLGVQVVLVRELPRAMR